MRIMNNDFNNSDLIPNTIYKGKSFNEDDYKDKSNKDVLYQYFNNVEDDQGNIIKGSIVLNGQIRRRTVGYKGSYRPNAYIVVTYKKNRWYSTGNFIHHNIFQFLGDTNVPKSEQKENKRGNKQLFYWLNNYLENYDIDKAVPLFLFEEIDINEYKYIGLGFPFSNLKIPEIKDAFSKIEINKNNEIYDNCFFKFIVDTYSTIKKAWLYDLRIGQGNKSDFMPNIWRDFCINGLSSEALKSIMREDIENNQRIEIIETSTIKTGSVIIKGQSKIRNYLLKHKKSCELCGLDYPWLLVASHIVPWSAKNYSNIETVRGNISNVMLLCSQHDKLFDRNYISFDSNGDILISDEINELDYKKTEYIK